MGSIASGLAVVGIKELGKGDLDIAGGKGANLGELLRAGLPVPDGFVVTTDAYAEAADAAGLPERIDTAEPAELRGILEQAPIPDELRAAVTDAYARLGEDVPVAVRSSATAEDLPGAAFAGQQDTYLNVIGADAVLDAVRRCWGSLWTDRAVSYRRERRIDPVGVRIAVVVQVLIDADVAGVMFTADPVSGARDRILVDAAAGLGEAVVSGLVDTEHYELDQDGALLRWSPGRADVAIRSSAGGGVHNDVPRPTGSRLLRAGQLGTLAMHARAAAAHFGRPQDMEWAVADGEVFILQARPMTALPPEPMKLNRRQRVQSMIFSEYLPVRPYPLDVTTWLGRGPAEMMRQITQYYGLRGAFTDFLLEEDGVVTRFVPPNPHPGPGILLAPIRLIRKTRRFRPERWQEDPRLATLLARADELDELSLSSLEWRELLQVPERALRLIDISRDLRIDYLPGAAIAIVRLIMVVTLLGRRRLLTELLGGAPTRTAAAERELVRLAGIVREDAALRAVFAEATPTDVLAELDTGRFPDFDTALDRFRREYGRKETVSPLLVSPPTLAESPDVILGMVSGFVDSPPQGDRRSEDALARLLEHRLLHAGRARAAVSRWVRAAQAGVACREDSHFYFTASLPALRRSLLEIGRRLQLTGAIDEPFDVFHLRWEEIVAIDEVAQLTEQAVANLRGRVIARAARRAELAALPVVDVRGVYRDRRDGDAVVTGTPAGAGVASGPVRVIREVADFHRLQPGDVLVCPYTNPAWTPLFLRAVAVVVDTGSMASHAAIVAREYGLPAIMGTGDGTRVLSDGDAVTVDGSTGRVTRA
ncbi:PEP/pyruvate-binding domain-containing protein [Microbacterium sp.]|uniref:PEP/pyruvate-binding domain-containing protein n=1 Tax=Microbacterium sp. TaxID=51671 RepID=UPI002810B9FC|nr:PEP/pyruvate-binding domain-containing protein [Microbacterium sp.]